MAGGLAGIVEGCPVIAAIKDDEGLIKCLESDINIVFVLYGDLCSIAGIVERLKTHGKTAMVHLDLLGGLSNKDAIAVDFIRERTRADGIITTKPALVRRAKELGLYTIQRFFVLDSLALENIRKQTEKGSTDLIEILPGVMPKIISRICGMVDVPVIAGGLISDREDVMAALNAGAVAVSTTRREVWDL